MLAPLHLQLFGLAHFLPALSPAPARRVLDSSEPSEAGYDLAGGLGSGAIGGCLPRRPNSAEATGLTAGQSGQRGGGMVLGTGAHTNCSNSLTTEPSHLFVVSRNAGFGHYLSMPIGSLRRTEDSA